MGSCLEAFPSMDIALAVRVGLVHFTWQMDHSFLHHGNYG